MQVKTKILQFGNNTGILVTEEVLNELGGGKRPLVKVTLNGYTYRGAVGKMKDMYLISLSAANRKNAGVQGGEELEIGIALDLEKREVDLPADLKVRLDQNQFLQSAFDKLAPSKQKAIVFNIEEAKSDETRKRRIEKVIQNLQKRTWVRADNPHFGGLSEILQRFFQHLHPCLAICQFLLFIRDDSFRSIGHKPLIAEFGLDALDKIPGMSQVFLDLGKLFGRVFLYFYRNVEGFRAMDELNALSRRFFHLLDAGKVGHFIQQFHESSTVPVVSYAILDINLQWKYFLHLDGCFVAFVTDLSHQFGE